MIGTDDYKLNTCGCCKKGQALPSRGNAPGLGAIAYRTGTYSVFMRRMLERLSSQEVGGAPGERRRPLAALTTRASGDPAVAMLDAWAVASDVLTFYLERIANEGYLRTATERRSVLELARAVGYELKPGTAASTYLAFTLEDAPGAAETAAVPPGTKVQSIPAPGQLPQTFETDEAFSARVRWNVLRPRQTEPQHLICGTDRIYLAGIRPDIRKGDLLLVNIGDNHDYMIVSEVTPENAKGRTLVVFTHKLSLDNSMHQFIKEGVVTRVPDFDEGSIDTWVREREWRDDDLNTFLAVNEWDPRELLLYLDTARLAPDQVAGQEVLAFRQKAAIFGHNAQHYNALPKLDLLDRVRNDLAAMSGFLVNLVSSLAARDPTLADIGQGITAVKNLAAQIIATQATIKNEQRDLANELNNPYGMGFNWMDINTELSSIDNDLNDIKTLLGQQNTRLSDVGQDLTAVRNSYSALSPVIQNIQASVSKIQDEIQSYPYRYNWDLPGVDEWNVWMDSLTGAYYQVNGRTHGIYLERVVEGILPGQWVVLERPELPPAATTAPEPAYKAYRVKTTCEESLTGFAISGRATGILLDTGVVDISYKVRKTTAHAQSDLLELAELPIDGPLEKGDTVSLDRFVPGLKKGQPLILKGERSDAPGVTGYEVLTLKEIRHHCGYTTIKFSDSLAHSYKRSTVAIYGNIVHATHGETVREVLGSGNGALENQRFVLKKPPLTYVSAPTSAGARSTLTVRVNDVLWSEVPSLYSIGPDARHYLVRVDDDALAMVIFGDGRHGARLSGGVENVLATYRSGSGPDGEVDAGALSLLQTRPPGVREVTNPLPARGASAPEKLEDARLNAPRTVLTMGRIVSLSDYEDFARAFAGVGKARATLVQQGESSLVDIVIADEKGRQVAQASDLYRNLSRAIEASRDPGCRFKIRSFEPVYFGIDLGVMAAADLDSAAVHASVIQAVSRAFSFGERSFGQGVTMAEILEVAQKVPGVVAARLDAVRRYEDDMVPDASAVPGFTKRKFSIQESALREQKVSVEEKDPMRFGGIAVSSSQLLLINPYGITLAEMKL